MYFFNGFIGNFDGSIIRKPTEPPHWNHYKSVMETITNYEKLQLKKETIHAPSPTLIIQPIESVT